MIARARIGRLSVILVGVLFIALPVRGDDREAGPTIVVVAPADVAALPPDVSAAPADEFYDDFYLESAESVGPGDPLEPMNRVFFGFNEVLDIALLSPLSRGYGWVMPEPGKKAVRRFFNNLGEPGTMVNHLLQGEGSNAGATLARFLLNTTVGIAGIFDPATRLGLREHPADFGQTLYRAGVGSGPYLVLPLLGSSTVRDAVGEVVDRLMRPETYFLGIGTQILVGTSYGIATREQYLEQVAQLRESSLDFYAAMRSIYIQTQFDTLATTNFRER